MASPVLIAILVLLVIAAAALYYYTQVRGGGTPSGQISPVNPKTVVFDLLPFFAPRPAR